MSKVRVYLEQEDLDLLNEHICKAIHQHAGYKCVILKPHQLFKIAVNYVLNRDISTIKKKNKLNFYSDGGK